MINRRASLPAKQLIVIVVYLKSSPNPFYVCLVYLESTILSRQQLLAPKAKAKAIAFEVAHYGARHEGPSAMQTPAAPSRRRDRLVRVMLFQAGFAPGERRMRNHPPAVAGTRTSRIGAVHGLRRGSRLRVCQCWILRDSTHLVDDNKIL